jgi:hypothetical protein
MAKELLASDRVAGYRIVEGGFLASHSAKGCSCSGARMNPSDAV